MIDINKLYTVNEAAAKLSVSRNTMERIIARGELAVIWVSPRKRVISGSELSGYIKQKTTGIPRG